MSQNADTLRRMFADFERLDFAAVASCCAPDCVYQDVPIPEATVTGPEAIRAKLEYGLGNLERAEMIVHELLEQGDTLLVERTEVWHHRCGTRATLPVAAVFKLRDGKLVLWRDYWDFKTLLDQQPDDWLPEIPRPWKPSPPGAGRPPGGGA